MSIYQSNQPPIKYPGGKRLLVDRIKTYWDRTNSRRLVEPFSGGMAVSLGIAPKKALINDINPHVINFYQQIQSGLSIEIEMKNDESYYYDMREHFNQLIRDNMYNTPLGASIFYYLNRTCFNGLIRFNKSKLFNVPFGKYKTITYFREFPEIQHIIKDWKLVCGDFSKIRINKTDFLYVDPPYDVEFRNYSGDNFEWQEQVRLVDHLAKYECPIVLSNQATDKILELYQDNGYEIHKINARRRISCKGDREEAEEVIALRNIK